MRKLYIFVSQSLRPMKKITFIFLAGLLFIQCQSGKTAQKEIVRSQLQPASSAVKIYTRPKLVVGIVVDQMRYDYLTRFWDRYGDDGFKRLISGGYLLKNNHFNYVPTYTAPGHACVYTGTSPRFNGIISNTWYDKTTDQYVYCVADNTVSSVGTQTDEGQRSPHRLLSSTICDQNRLATQFRGKTIGVALKDRASILPAGRSANAAYWFVGGQEGHFVTSSYYRESLPTWVQQFNASGKTEQYLKPWHTLYPISTYTESGKDDSRFEGKFKGKATTTFPYDLKKLYEHYGFGILKRVAFGNNLTTDFALAALEGEQLGQDEYTDFLTISYSSTDYVGHQFGVNSKEIEDTYLRLDRQIARLLDSLDQKIGRGHYTVFLTADHAGVQVPAYLHAHNMAAGYFDADQFEEDLKHFIGKHFATTSLLKNISNHQIFFNYKALNNRNISPDKFGKSLLHFIQNYPKIAQVYTRKMLESGSYTGLVGMRIKNGFHPTRSGDLAFVLDPATISYSTTGSTHGSPYTYDTHTPVIFYGKGIRKGQTTRATSTVDIAPTIAALLGIQAPNACTGTTLSAVIE